MSSDLEFKTHMILQTFKENSCKDFAYYTPNLQGHLHSL
jgi:hypothetical protein